MRTLLALCIMLLLSACVSTPALIVGPSKDAAGNTVQPSPLTPALEGIAGDIQGAASNLDNAIAIGVLPPNDPAAKCAHDALVMAGVEVPPGATPSKSFVPKHGGVLTDGATLYIITQQAKNSTGVTIDVSCKALLGQMVIDGLSAFNKTLPGMIAKKLVGLP